MLVAKIWNTRKQLPDDKRSIPRYDFFLDYLSDWLKVSSPLRYFLAGIETGELYQRHVNANPSQYNHLEAVPAFSKPVLLIGRENMNKAVNGDVAL